MEQPSASCMSHGTVPCRLDCPFSYPVCCCSSAAVRRHSSCISYTTCPVITPRMSFPIDCHIKILCTVRTVCDRLPPSPHPFPCAKAAYAFRANASGTLSRHPWNRSKLRTVSSRRALGQFRATHFSRSIQSGWALIRSSSPTKANRTGETGIPHQSVPVKRRSDLRRRYLSTAVQPKTR